MYLDNEKKFSYNRPPEASDGINMGLNDLKQNISWILDGDITEAIEYLKTTDAGQQLHLLKLDDNFIETIRDSVDDFGKSIKLLPELDESFKKTFTNELTSMVFNAVKELKDNVSRDDIFKYKYRAPNAENIFNNNFSKIRNYVLDQVSNQGKYDIDAMIDVADKFDTKLDNKILSPLGLKANANREVRQRRNLQSFHMGNY